MDRGQSFKIALVGNPNTGKTALFNALTGGRARIGNYPGVTVERKEGSAQTPAGLTASILDLPGIYSVDAKTPDEVITTDILRGANSESPPDLWIAVADATNLERGLALILELISLKKPMILALNMIDLAAKQGQELDLKVLSEELGMPIVPTSATHNQGIQELVAEAEKVFSQTSKQGASQQTAPGVWPEITNEAISARFAEVDRILRLALLKPTSPNLWTERIDRVVLHPVWGSLLLFFILGLVFQVIFTWAQIPMDLIKDGVEGFGQFCARHLPEGALTSLLLDGAVAGVGSVLVFLPQIILLFLFILVLEDSGYMARAAFLMDRMMGKVGLHGRAFIPLLSSFACSIPGIMATRTIENKRDRLTTILVSPLITCSARLPVYSLLIAAFIPNQVVFGPVRLQGLVMFLLYLLGCVTALAVALLFRKTLLKGPKPPLLMELPTYKWPSARNIYLGLLDRCRLFVRKAGTVILAVSIVLWFFVSYPKPPENADAPAIAYSYAGQFGHWVEPLVLPIGFNWKIAVALIPGFIAREVMISSLATVYAVETKGDGVAEVLGASLAKDWSMATALSLLMWYVLAFQCLSTLAVAKRETNTWHWPLFMLFYMTCLAYLGSYITYRGAVSFGLG